MTESTGTNASPWAPLDLAVAKAAIRWDGDHTAVPVGAVEALVRGADGPQLAALAGMDGASWSEIDAQLDRVYPDERGLDQPTGLAAAELVARSLIEEAASEDLNGLRAIECIHSLWVSLGYPDGDLMDLGSYSTWLDMARDGTAEGTPASVVTDFVVACERILAAGGPRIDD